MQRLARKKTKTPPKKILVYAGELLSRSSHSTQKLREKLLKKGYPEEEVTAAIEKLTHANYLDDEKLAQRTLTVLLAEKKQSLRYIIEKLYRNKIPKDIIMKALENQENIEEREIETALKMLQKKYQDQLDIKKSKAYLYQKGFTITTIEKAITLYHQEKNKTL